MSNTMRWRYGETNPIMVPTPLGHAIEIGDLVYLDNGSAKPATSQTDQGTLTANQETFHDNFVGVAMQCSADDTTDPVRVATSGVFEYDCSASTFELGELIGINEDGTGTQLDPQQVAVVATENLAIGRCTKQESSSTDKVLIDIVSTVLRGGPQAAA